MRVEGRWMPEVLRGRLARDRAEHQQRWERSGRLIGAVVLGSLVLIPGVGCLGGAILGGIGAAIEGLEAMVLGAASGGIAGALGGIVLALVEVLILAIMAGVFRTIRRAAHERVQEQLSFVIALLDALLDDLHPARKVAVCLDTEGLTPGKRTWTGRSIHGNPKRRYGDRWLVLRFVGVDGTTYRLRMQADVKTKHANDVILKVKRKMDLRIRPPRARTFDLPDLEAAALDAIALAFHDPPEKVRAVATAGEGGARIAVMQLDAPIFPDEVVALAAAALTATRAAR